MQKLWIIVCLSLILDTRITYGTKLLYDEKLKPMES